MEQHKESQEQLPGMPLTETRITGSKLTDVLIETGKQICLEKLRADLMAAQKQHPSAVGLTLAIALVERDKSAATLETTRTSWPLPRRRTLTSRARC
jgi:hypothetical protein